MPVADEPLDPWLNERQRQYLGALLVGDQAIGLVETIDPDFQSLLRWGYVERAELAPDLVVAQITEGGKAALESPAGP